MKTKILLIVLALGLLTLLAADAVHGLAVTNVITVGNEPVHITYDSHKRAVRSQLHGNSVMVSHIRQQ